MQSFGHMLVKQYPRRASTQLVSEVYGTFQFAKFFRKNVTLMSSVIPDPGSTCHSSKHEGSLGSQRSAEGVDFPQAVELIERGSFSTEGLSSAVRFRH